MSAQHKTEIKKIKAFPIAAKLTFGTEAKTGQILKLTPTGFLVEAAIAGLKTGEKFAIDFELPVLHSQISGPCVLVKLYTTVETHVIEGHFENLPQDQETKIMKFLASIPKASGT